MDQRVPLLKRDPVRPEPLTVRGPQARLLTDYDDSRSYPIRREVVVLPDVRELPGIKDVITTQRRDLAFLAMPADHVAAGAEDVLLHVGPELGDALRRPDRIGRDHPT